MQGDAFQQLTVERRYKEVWHVQGKGRCRLQVPEASFTSANAASQPFDGNLEISLPDNVPANQFAPDVLL